MTRDLFRWGSLVERERRRRIMLSIWAYAYEFEHKSLVSDHEFDAVARESEPWVRTGRYDDWWRTMFSPSTGMWIHTHPDLPGVALAMERYYAGQQYTTHSIRVSCSASIVVHDVIVDG